MAIIINHHRSGRRSFSTILLRLLSSCRSSEPSITPSKQGVVSRSRSPHSVVSMTEEMVEAAPPGIELSQPANASDANSVTTASSNGGHGELNQRTTSSLRSGARVGQPRVQQGTTQATPVSAKTQASATAATTHPEPPTHDSQFDIIIPRRGGGTLSNKQPGFQLWTARINAIDYGATLEARKTEVKRIIDSFLADGRKIIRWCRKNDQWVTTVENSPDELIKELKKQAMQKIRDHRTNDRNKEKKRKQDADDAQSTVSLFIIMFDSNTFHCCTIIIHLILIFHTIVCCCCAVILIHYQT